MTNSHSLPAVDNTESGPRNLPLLLGLFVASGCAALIYEIVWFQLLQLVIGLTNVSLGVLLGTYMGGMCLGSLVLPHLISPRHHPLRVYAFLELGIGAIAIMVLWFVPWVSQIYTESVGRGLPGIFLRGVVAGLCLLPPTVLMGATLPAISRWVEATPRGVSWLGFFYGGNIIGAVFGCFFAGFYLLRVHDMATATYAAAALNAGVAAAALVIAGRSKHRPLFSEGQPATRSALPGPWSVYVTIALSGMSALGAEVVWTRLLSLLLGGTVYTFSIILAVFLIGLGIGSSTGSLLARWSGRPRLALGGAQAMLVAAVAWSAWAIARSLPYWPINPSLSQSPWFTFQLDIARCLWAILPAAILWGASFPMALAAVASRQEDSGRVVGRVYAANTVGAIVGALAFSLLVVPLLGTQWAERLLIALSAAAACCALAPVLFSKEAAIRPVELDVNRSVSTGGNLSSETVAAAAVGSAFRPGRALAGAGCLGLAALLIWSIPAAPWGLVAYGRFIAGYGNRLAPEIVKEEDVPDSGTPDIFCTYLGEGLNGSVAVTKWTSGARSFHSAGKVQASTEPHDMRLQRLLGHISALAHQKPESVLVVACGAGVTAGTFVLHPDVKQIVICDIEPLVPKVVAPMFAKENYNVVNDPRTRIVLDDGRHFIRTSKEKFDIITSDPIDPWVKGCAALNTVEYYEMCKQHLKPGGVMSLWIPLYESDSATVKSVIATFFKVFPNGVLLSNDNEGEGYDAVLFSQAEPMQLNVDEIQQRLNRTDHATVKQSLADVGFNSAISLLGTYAGRAADLEPWTRDAQINTDRNLRLQYLAGMGFNSFLGSEILGEITRYYKFPENLFVGSEERLQLLKVRLNGTSGNQVSSTRDATSGSTATNKGPAKPSL